MMTLKQQQRLIGTLLLVFFIAVLAYIVLSKVSQTESGRQQAEEEPIEFSSVIEPMQEEAGEDVTQGLDSALVEEAFVDIDSGVIEDISQSAISSETSEAETVTEAAPAPEKITPTPAPVAPTPAPKPELAPIVETPEPAPTPSAPAESQPEPPAISSTQTESASQWILQLGSFSVEANATSLKKQLEDIGYQPMIEQTRSSGTVIYRVRLQPKADRAELEKTAESIRNRLNLNTQIFPYP